MWQRFTDIYWREGNRVFLWVPALLAVGSGVYFSLRFEPPLGISLILTVCLAAACGALYRQRLSLWIVPFLLMATGFVAAHIETRLTDTPMLQRDVGYTPLTGTIADIELLPQGRRLWISQPTIAKAAQPVEMIRLIDRKAEQPLTIGQKIEMTAFVRAIPPPVLPGEFDFRRHAFFAGLGATGYVIAITPTAVTEVAPDSFASWRQQVQEKVAATLVGDPAAITTALLTGSQNGISADVMEDMRLSGLTHILSVSGLHIGLAAGIIFFLLRGLLALFPSIALRYPIKKWAAAASWFGALAYTLFVGAPVPAIRSLLMIGFGLLAIMVDRTALSLRVVALTATMILLIAPDALLGPSFQLSYAAIAAIIALYEATDQTRHRLMEHAGWIKRGLMALAAIAITSIAASLATAPLTHYHFQQLQGYGVVSNMLAIPLTSFWLMPAALIAFVVMPFGLEHWPLWLLGKGIEWLMWIADSVAHLPGANWQPANLPLPALILMVLGALWLLIWQLRWRWLGLLPITAGIIIAMFPAQPLAIIADDGRFAAIKRGDGYVLFSDNDRRRDDSFTPNEWQQWLGVKEYEKADALCNSAYCQSNDIVFVRDQNILPEVCDGKNIIIHPHGLLKNCGQQDIDRKLLKRERSIMLENDGRLKSVEGTIGARPWNPKTYQDEDQ